MFVNMATANQSSGNGNVEVMDRRSQQPEQGGAVLPGFRFHPTDEELIGYYLRRKVMHRPASVEVITPLNIYDFNPWDLPKMSVMKGEKEWYFFCPRNQKYRNSPRPNRVTGAGFWKATGTDRPISSGDGKQCIGLKKSLVFYTGRAAKSTKTDWMMHEFRMPADSEASNLGDEIALQQESWAVCRIFKKCTLAQRHAPQSQPWATMQPQHFDATATNFAPGSLCTPNPDLEHDNSPARSDTTSEELEVERSIQRTVQDPLPNYLRQRQYAAMATQIQHPQKQEQSTATWPLTMSNSMDNLLQDASSPGSNSIIRQRSHLSSEIYPLEMPNSLFVQDSTSMRGALEYVSCIINPPQSGPQFVGSNFSDSNNRRESMNMSDLQSPPIDSIGSSVGPRMNTPLGVFRNELAQQIPQQEQLAEPFFSAQAWG